MNSLSLVSYHGIPSELDAARLPILYESAIQSLENCYRIDECKDWANKAEALASYYKQANDKIMFDMATRIQGRAVRRYGILLKEISPGQGARDGKRREGDLTPLTRTKAASQAGISEWGKVTALRIASIPEPVFEQAIEQDCPPSIAKLSELGTQHKPAPAVPVVPVSKDALVFWDHLKDLEREGFLSKTLDDFTATMTVSMRADVARLIPVISRFFQSLEQELTP